MRAPSTWGRGCPWYLVGAVWCGVQGLLRILQRLSAMQASSHIFANGNELHKQQSASLRRTRDCTRLIAASAGAHSARSIKPLCIYRAVLPVDPIASHDPTVYLFTHTPRTCSTPAGNTSGCAMARMTLSASSWRTGRRSLPANVRCAPRHPASLRCCTQSCKAHRHAEPCHAMHMQSPHPIPHPHA